MKKGKTDEIRNNVDVNSGLVLPDFDKSGRRKRDRIPHYNMHGEPRMYRFYGLDDYLLERSEIREFTIDSDSDTIYVVYSEDSMGKERMSLTIWNKNKKLTYYPGRTRKDSTERKESISSPIATEWFSNLVEEWNTAKLRCIEKEYMWNDRIRTASFGIAPEYMYLSRIIVKHDSLSIDTLQGVDPTLQGQLKIFIEKHRN